MRVDPGEARERMHQAEAEGVKHSREEKKKRSANGAAGAHRFNLVRFREVKLATTAAYLIKGIIPREGLIVAWGPPKCGKSFLIFDALMHIALNWEYRGHRVAQGPVVYLACEGERGLGARVAAFKRKHGLLAEDPQFFLITTRLDLVADYHTLIADIRAQIGAVKPAAIAIDTLNRSIRGSESSDEDMGAYVQAADAIREAFSCAVIVIHHCGIDDKRPRGHTSLTGACDAQLAVKRDANGTITMTVEWMKDGADGETICSRLEVVEVDKDDDGEQITSCVITAAEAPAPGKGGSGLTKNQQSMLAILADAGKGGLTVDEWNDRAREAGVGTKRRTDLYDCRIALKRQQLVYEWEKKWFVQR
jgi:hypothetical protein